MKTSIEVYQNILHLQDANFIRIEHEEAMVALVYKIIQSDGMQLILKICERPKDYLREVYFLNYFAGKLPVPKVIQAVEPSEELCGAILLENLSGELLQASKITESLAFELGRNLAFIHLNHLHGYGDVIQDNLSADPRKYFTFKFEEGMAECQHHLPLSLLNKCRSYYESHLDLLLSVDGPCIVHRDYRPGNLIVSEGRLQGIIDWSGARASFAEEDLCSLEHGEWGISLNDKKMFLAGYASVRPIPDYNHLISFLRLNKAIASIGFTVKRGTWKSRTARLYKYNRDFLDSF